MRFPCRGPWGLRAFPGKVEPSHPKEKRTEPLAEAFPPGAPQDRIGQHHPPCPKPSALEEREAGGETWPWASHLLLLADRAVASHPLHPPRISGTVLLDLLQLLQGENYRDPGHRDVGPAEVVLPGGSGGWRLSQ